MRKDLVSFPKVLKVELKGGEKVEANWNTHWEKALKMISEIEHTQTFINEEVDKILKEVDQIILHREGGGECGL